MNVVACGNLERFTGLRIATFARAMGTHFKDPKTRQANPMPTAHFQGNLIENHVQQIPRGGFTDFQFLG